jgi:small subunit ribosomal protein S3
LGENQEKLKKITKKINSLIDDNRVNLHLNLLEVKKVYNCAQSIANLITGPIKKRSPFRLVLRNILSKISLEKATEGAKIEIKGRLDESDNAQTKKALHKQMPLSTIDSNAEFGRQEVVTSYGKIGVKV